MFYNHVCPQAASKVSDGCSCHLTFTRGYDVFQSWQSHCVVVNNSLHIYTRPNTCMRTTTIYILCVCRGMASQMASMLDVCIETYVPLVPPTYFACGVKSTHVDLYIPLQHFKCTATMHAPVSTAMHGTWPLLH